MNDAHVENKKYPRGDLRFSHVDIRESRESDDFPCKDMLLGIRGQKLEIRGDTLYYSEHINLSMEESGEYLTTEAHATFFFSDKLY